MNDPKDQLQEPLIQHGQEDDYGQQDDEYAVFAEQQDDWNEVSGDGPPMSDDDPDGADAPHADADEDYAKTSSDEEEYVEEQDNRDRQHEVNSLENRYIEMLVKEFKGKTEGDLQPCFDFQAKENSKEVSKQYCKDIALHPESFNDRMFVVSKFREFHMINVDNNSVEEIYEADDWIRSFKVLGNGTIIIAGDFNKLVVLNQTSSGDNLENLGYVEGQSFDLTTIKFSAEMEFDPADGFLVKKLEVTPEEDKLVVVLDRPAAILLFDLKGIKEAKKPQALQYVSVADSEPGKQWETLAKKVNEDQEEVAEEPKQQTVLVPHLVYINHFENKDSNGNTGGGMEIIQVQIRADREQIIYADDTPQIAILSLTDCQPVQPKKNEKIVQTIYDNSSVYIGQMLLDAEKNILYVRTQRSNGLLVIQIAEVEDDIKVETVELKSVDNFSPMLMNAGLLYYADDKGLVTVYDIGEQQVVAMFKADSPVTSLCLSRDGLQLYLYTQTCKLYKIFLESSDYKVIEDIKNVCCMLTHNNDFWADGKKSDERQSLFASFAAPKQDDEDQFKKLKAFYVGKRDCTIHKISSNDYTQSQEITKLQSEPLQLAKEKDGPIMFAVTNAQEGETHDSSLWLVDQSVRKKYTEEAPVKPKNQFVDLLGDKLFAMVQEQQDKLKVIRAKTELLRKFDGFASSMLPIQTGGRRLLFVVEEQHRNENPTVESRLFCLDLDILYPIETADKPKNKSLFGSSAQSRQKRVSLKPVRSKRVLKKDATPINDTVDEETQQAEDDPQTTANSEAEEVEFEEGVEMIEFEVDEKIRRLAYIEKKNMLVVLIGVHKGGFLRFLDATTMEETRKDLYLEHVPVSLSIDPDELNLSVGLANGEVLYSSISAIFEEEEPFEEQTDHKEHVMDIQYVEGHFGGLLVTIGLDQRLFIRNNFQKKLTMELELDFYPQNLLIDQENNKIILGGINDDLDLYQLYEIEMNPFMREKKDGEDGEKELVPNFFPLEVIRQFCTGTPEQQAACFNLIKRKTMINWAQNLITLCACLGDKATALKFLLQQGIPYTAGLDGLTPIEHLLEINDLRSTKILGEALEDETVIYTADAEYMQTQFQETFMGAFSFYPGEITHRARVVKHIIGEGFQGRIKEKIAPSPTRMVTAKMMEQCVDFSPKEGKKSTILCQTFRVKMNLQLESTGCQQQLESLIETGELFLEDSKIDLIINQLFYKYWNQIAVYNSIYILQTALVSAEMALELDSKYCHDIQFVISCYVISLEMMQICIQGGVYFLEPFNWLQLLGNVMVLNHILLANMEEYLWFMLLCLTMNGVASLRFFQGQRLLVMMIIQCIRGMIPFLVLLFMCVFMFAVMNHAATPKKERTFDKFQKGLGAQYMMLFGDNPENESWVQWTLWLLFSITQIVVSFNLLIAIISDDYARVQADKKPNELRSMCEMLLEMGQIKRFIHQKVLCGCFMEISDDELMYIHRFFNIGEEDGDEGGDNWAGGMKMVMTKQDELTQSIKNVEKNFEQQLRKNIKQVEKKIDSNQAMQQLQQLTKTFQRSVTQQIEDTLDALKEQFGDQKADISKIEEQMRAKDVQIEKHQETNDQQAAVIQEKAAENQQYHVQIQQMMAQSAAQQAEAARKDQKGGKQAPPAMLMPPPMAAGASQGLSQEAIDNIMKEMDKKMEKQNEKMDKIENELTEQQQKAGDNQKQMNDKMKNMDDKLIILMDMISNMQD